MTDLINVASIDSIIGANTKIKGDIDFKGQIRINGEFEGNIISENGTVIIGENANIFGEIKTANAVIKGRIKGNITVDFKIDVFIPANIEGNMKASLIKMETGVIFNGNCKMEKTDKKPIPFSPLIQEDLEKNQENEDLKKSKKSLLKSLTNVFSKDT